MGKRAGRLVDWRWLVEEMRDRIHEIRAHLHRASSGPGWWRGEVRGEAATVGSGGELQWREEAADTHLAVARARLVL